MTAPAKKNNIQVGNAKDLDIVMSMYNLIQYNNNYEETSESIWQYRKDDSRDNITDYGSIKLNQNS